MTECIIKPRKTKVNKQITFDQNISTNIPLVLSDEIRSRCRNYFIYCLASKNIKHGENYAKQLEEAIFVFSEGEFVKYKQKAYQLCFNLTKNGNFLASTYSPNVLIFIDESLLAEGTDIALRKIQHEKRLQRLQQIMNEDDEEDDENLGTFMVCVKCKSTQFKPTWYQKQIRSADEPAHVFCQCTNPVCLSRWTLK